MINETKLIGLGFKYRQKAIAKYASQTEAIQDNVLQNLLHKAEKTEWGKKYDYHTKVIQRQKGLKRVLTIAEKNSPFVLNWNN